ncbi:MAG: Crp/Fnr family transcriptional regulator, partial [Chloroflexi bacterium]|nr:Crp/Fnr family transcriptional regulator [Chloroflexota bacterium]
MVRARLPGILHPDSRAEANRRVALEERERSRKMGYLSAMDIFRDLAPEEMAQLDRMTRMTTAQRGQVLYVPGKTGEMLFLLKRGRVQLYGLSPDGRKFIIAVLEPETFFGDMTLLGQAMASTFAEAVEDSTVCMMTRDDVEALILRKPQVSLRLLEVLGRRLLEAEDRLQEVAFKRVPARVASLLLRLAAQEGGREIHLSHQEIAEMLGIYRETATNALDHLK